MLAVMLGILDSYTHEHELNTTNTFDQAESRAMQVSNHIAEKAHACI